MERYCKNNGQWERNKGEHCRDNEQWGKDKGLEGKGKEGQGIGRTMEEGQWGQKGL